MKHPSGVVSIAPADRLFKPLKKRGTSPDMSVRSVGVRSKLKRPGAPPVGYVFPLFRTTGIKLIGCINNHGFFFSLLVLSGMVQNNLALLLLTYLFI